jgi:hypothetical protein
MQSPCTLPLNLPIAIPKEKASKPWSDQEKHTVLSLGSQGMKTDQILPYVPGRTKAAVQGILTRNLPIFKTQQVTRQTAEINNQLPPPPLQQSTQGSKSMLHHSNIIRL